MTCCSPEPNRGAESMQIRLSWLGKPTCAAEEPARASWEIASCFKMALSNGWSSQDCRYDWTSYISIVNVSWRAKSVGVASKDRQGWGTDIRARSSNVKYSDLLTDIQEGISQAQRDKSVRNIVRRLNNTNPSLEHNAACQKHERGTGSWLVSGKTFESWMRSDNSLLWINGGGQYHRCLTPFNIKLLSMLT